MKGSVLDTIRSLVKFNFGVGTRDVGEESVGEMLEAGISLFRRSDGSSASQMLLGEISRPLGEGLGVKTESHPHNIFNTPTSDMSVESDTSPLLRLRFLEGGGKEIIGEMVARGSSLCMSLQHEFSIASHLRSR